MDPAAAGFKGAAQPSGCGETSVRKLSFADAQFMKQYNPQARVDQLVEYRSSVPRTAPTPSGDDPVPATCIDCHGIHGIQKVGSPNSPVFAANVPETCSASCHADAGCHAANTACSTEPVSALPRKQFTCQSRCSIASDTAAPACNDCHGNHGAACLPGVQSVANVCGQCHGREASLFRASIKNDLFEALEVAECTVCHGNHRIVHPTPEMFRSASAPQVSGGTVARVDPFEAAFGDLPPGETAWAEWSAVVAPHLDSDDERLAHTVTVDWDGGTSDLDATVRPGQPLPQASASDGPPGEPITRLSVEPLSGLPVEAGDAVRLRVEIEAPADRALRELRVSSRPGVGIHVVEGSVCLTCHSIGDECDQATELMYATLTETQRNLREAGRQLHEVERAGIDVGEMQFELGSTGQTAIVEGNALIHAFDPQRLVERAEAGNEVATAALAAAEAARTELLYRRRGLGISLVLIALALVGLYLKIRQIDRAGSQVSSKSTMTVK